MLLLQQPNMSSVATWSRSLSSAILAAILLIVQLNSVFVLYVFMFERVAKKRKQKKTVCTGQFSCMHNNHGIIDYLFISPLYSLEFNF